MRKSRSKSRYPRAGTAADRARLKNIIDHLPDAPSTYVITRNVIVSKPGEEEHGPRRFELQRIVVAATSLADAKWMADFAKIEREEAIGHRHRSPAGAMR